jgi:hypothetical protein
MVRIFFARKIRGLRPGLNSRTLVPEGSMLTTIPLKPLLDRWGFRLCGMWCQFVWWMVANILSSNCYMVNSTHPTAQQHKFLLLCSNSSSSTFSSVSSYGSTTIMAKLWYFQLVLLISFYPGQGFSSLALLTSVWLYKRPGDRIPVGAKFFAPVETGPRARPASCTMGTGSFLGVRRPGRDTVPSTPSRAED